MYRSKFSYCSYWNIMFFVRNVINFHCVMTESTMCKLGNNGWIVRCHLVHVCFLLTSGLYEDHKSSCSLQKLPRQDHRWRDSQASEAPAASKCGKLSQTSDFFFKFVGHMNWSVIWHNLWVQGLEVSLSLARSLARSLFLSFPSRVLTSNWWKQHI